ncbi:hypothetical protein CVT30_46780 (plasmid) [Streptomyces sp. AMCC400023]|nr:hypothetical protein CVT30_46780 [Streptomyces sp. AMCC400023]
MRRCWRLVSRFSEMLPPPGRAAAAGRAAGVEQLPADRRRPGVAERLAALPRITVLDLDPATALRVVRQPPGRVRRAHGHGCRSSGSRASSVPVLQSLEKVQVREVRGPVEGLKGLKLSIMSQSCVRVRAGAYVSPLM